ncbi:hypothetical protein AVEN_190870-1 [Araneus ventricosus]|uniref:Uncharacterized protein n=1 Tax=Araneus ventricosus TaxID=182803 RepID=A0A4Y2CQG2_ARAVE|nr:hypothetical protein AVEN_190870-1 [Araneus ventricosus]
MNYFESLVKKLKDKFSKETDFEEAQKQFQNVRQKVSQSISNLADQISLKIEKFINPNNSEEDNLINLTKNLKFSKFIEALRPDIRLEVKKLGPKSFKAVVAMAKNVENALSEENVECNAVKDSGIN